jgi:NTP pyrophosphatase (non-canonical NTP hydrolase)
MTIQEAQQTVDRWINNYGVRYFNELTNMAVLTEEVGELARIIAREYGEQSYKESERRKSLSEELADILFVIICIANQTGTDLQKAFNASLEKKSQRDSERHLQNKKLQ